MTRVKTYYLKRNKKKKITNEKGSNRTHKSQRVETNGKKEKQTDNREMYLECKLAYSSKYAEYMTLCKEIESTQKKQFSDLGEVWKTSKSTDQENIDKQIVALYKENYEKTQQRKARYQELHKELKRLKNIIKNSKLFEIDGSV